MKKVIAIIFILAFILLLVEPLDRSTNEAYIQKLNPSVRNKVRKFLKDIEELGYKPVIRDSLRTYSEQQYYKSKNPKNATPGYSSHETGNAIDMDIYKDGKVLSKNTNKSLWIASGVIELANYYGIKWGGNFAGYADNNHFYFQ